MRALIRPQRLPDATRTHSLLAMLWCLIGSAAFNPNRDIRYIFRRELRKVDDSTEV